MRGDKITVFLTLIFSTALLCACSAKTGNTGNSGKGTFQTVISEVVDNVALDNTPSFRNDIAGTIGNHIYYSYNVFEGRNLSESEKDEVTDSLEQIDSTLTEDVFITGWGKSSLIDAYKFYGGQYINGAVCREVYYTSDLDSATPRMTNTSGLPPVKTLDTSGLVNPEDLIEKVMYEAVNHSSEICCFDRDGVYGDYFLRYDYINDKLVYEFSINEYSSITFDAHTGDIIEEYYFDGEFPD